MAISTDTILKAWNEFKKKPILAMLFAAIIGLGLWINDLRKDSNLNKNAQAKQNADCSTKVNTLENKITFMEHERRVTDSTLSAVLAQWKLMQKLGILKIPD